MLTLQNGMGPFTATVDTPLVTLAIDQAARTLTVTASQQTGRANVTVNDSTGAAVQIPVRVAIDAGTIPPAVTLRVTGTQIEPQWLSAQIQRALKNAIRVQPGALAQVGMFTLPQTIGPGATAAVPVPVQIAGGANYFDVQSWPTVTVQNVSADPFVPPLLLYDDDPEKIVGTGVLFRASVASDAPARLYYYHENSAENRDLAVVIASDSAAPSTVQLIDASAGPSIDVMSVGHAVSRDFLTQKALDEGIAVDIDAQTPYVADWFSMNAGQGVAGSIGVRVLQGGPVTVTVVSLPPDASAAQLPAAIAGPQLPGDGHHRTGVFSIAGYARDTLAFSVPGPDASTQYGAHTPPAATGTPDPPPAGHDYGDYGVLRTLDFDIDNPLDAAATLYLYERPLGGPVRSSFLVGGQLVQVGCARVSDRYQIGAPIDVAPHAKFVLPVQTMTDGGSNYPLEVGLTAAAPQPTVPPISAPDGCFPKPAPTAAPSQVLPAASPAPSGSPVPAPEPTG